MKTSFKHIASFSKGVILNLHVAVLAGLVLLYAGIRTNDQFAALIEQLLS